MKTQKSPQMGREAVTYSKRLPFYDSEEGMSLLQQLARQRGVKAAALLRMLVREEARRVGVLPPDVPASQAPVLTDHGGLPDRTAELFAAWDEEDATDDAEELARRGAEWEELKAQLNAHRAAVGEEPLF